MRILVVEDQPELIEVIRLQLLAEEMVVEAAKTAEEAIFMASINYYSVIIIDFNLIDSDGRGVIRSIRKQAITSPVLILSTNDDVREKVLSLDAGADDYLTKPYSPLELMARLKALARRGSKQHTGIYHSHGVELQIRARRVMLDEVEIALSRREFDLLQYMLEHAGEIVTREELWECVWGWDDYPLHNTVEVHIKRLRDKLSDRSGQIIETVRGVGYRISNENSGKMSVNDNQKTEKTSREGGGNPGDCVGGGD